MYKGGSTYSVLCTEFSNINGGACVAQGLRMENNNNKKKFVRRGNDGIIIKAGRYESNFLKCLNRARTDLRILSRLALCVGHDVCTVRN